MRGTFVFPRITTPAARSRETTAASALGTWLANDGAPAVVLSPAVSNVSLIVQGTPWKGPHQSPRARASSAALARVARETGSVIVASLFERRTAGVYHNTAAVLDADGSLLGIYRKMHIPDDPLYYEKYYFTPGDLGFRAFDTRYARVGVLVCWDQWYPEAARLTALQGAQVLLYPTAIGWHPREKAEFGQAQHQAWELVQRSHAVANGVYVAAVNRVGHEGPPEGGLEFWGASFVSDPFAGVLGRAPHQSEDILVVACDLRRLEEIRRHWPFLRDRRIDAYTEISRRVID